MGTAAGLTGAAAELGVAMSGLGVTAASFRATVSGFETTALVFGAAASGFEHTELGFGGLGFARPRRAGTETRVGFPTPANPFFEGRGPAGTSFGATCTGFWCLEIKSPVDLDRETVFVLEAVLSPWPAKWLEVAAALGFGMCSAPSRVAAVKVLFGITEAVETSRGADVRCRKAGLASRPFSCPFDDDTTPFGSVDTGPFSGGTGEGGW